MPPKKRRGEYKLYERTGGKIPRTTEIYRNKKLKKQIVQVRRMIIIFFLVYCFSINEACQIIVITKNRAKIIQFNLFI